MKLNTYTINGTRLKSRSSLPKEFVEKENLTLLAQAIRVYENRMHPGTSKVKGRGEVRGSTRKIYRQKGTGRARHGAITAPIFVGGGQVHGPDGKKRKLTINKKMAQKALKIALSIKAEDGELVVVKDIDKLKKTSEAAKVIKSVLKDLKIDKNSPRITFVLSQENMDSKKFIRNIENINIEYFRNINAYKVFYGGIIFVDQKALEAKKMKNKKSKKK